MNALWLAVLWPPLAQAQVVSTGVAPSTGPLTTLATGPLTAPATGALTPAATGFGAPFNSPGAPTSQGLPPAPYNSPGAPFGAPFTPPASTPPAPGTTLPAGPGAPGNVPASPKRERRQPAVEAALRALDEGNFESRKRLSALYERRRRALLASEEWVAASRHERKAKLKALKSDFRRLEQRLRERYRMRRAQITGDDKETRYESRL